MRLRASRLTYRAHMSLKDSDTRNAVNYFKRILKLIACSVDLQGSNPLTL